MTKSPRKNVPDVGIELGAACMPSELNSDRATAPGLTKNFNILSNADANADTVVTTIALPVLMYRQAKNHVQIMGSPAVLLT